MHLWRALEHGKMMPVDPTPVIPGKAAGRDPESIPLLLDSGFRRNDDKSLFRGNDTAKASSFVMPARAGIHVLWGIW